MAIPKEPRQAMINMMYLVLTALLAMNVSAEVLNAFVIVNDGMAVTNSALNASNNDYLKAIEKRAKTDSAAQGLFALATKSDQTAKDLYIEIDSIKARLLRFAGTMIDEKTGKKVPSAPSDTHAGTLYLVESPEKLATKLKEKILAVRQEFINLFPEERREDFAASMTLNAVNPPDRDGVPVSWEAHNFSDVPVIACMTILSKLQNDVLTTQTAVIEYIKSQIGIDNVEFDQLTGTAIAKKALLSPGEKYEADIFVSASSSSVKPKVLIGKLDREKIGTNEATGELNTEYDESNEPPIIGEFKEYLPLDGESKVRYEATAGGVGEQNYEGVIEILNTKTNKKKFYPFETTYLVAASQAVVSATAMNVFYIGVDNPVEISVPGYASRDILASLTGGVGSIKANGNGKYTVVLDNKTKARETKVSVSVKADAATRSVAAKEFRIKRIPDPKVYWGRTSGPSISQGEARGIAGLAAKADNFPLDVTYRIVSFEMVVKKRGGVNIQTFENKGNVFQPELKNVTLKSLPGDKYWFDNIKVRPPDGTTRTLSLSYTVIGG